MNFVRVIPYWLLSKATNVAAKDFVLDKNVVSFLMDDPYKNEAGELCVIQPVKSQKIVDLMIMHDNDMPVLTTQAAQLAVYAMRADIKTMELIKHLAGDIEEYNLKEVFLHVS